RRAEAGQLQRGQCVSRRPDALPAGPPLAGAPDQPGADRWGGARSGGPPEPRGPWKRGGPPAPSHRRAAAGRARVGGGARSADWRTMGRAFSMVGHSETYAPLFREGGAAERGGSLLARLQATSPDARAALLEDYLAAQVAGVFGTAEDKVDRDAPLTSLGLDSLMAVDLTSRIEREIGMGVPMGSLLSGPSIKVLAKTVRGLLAQSLGAEQGVAGTEPTEVGSLPLEKLIPQRDEFPLSEGQQALWFMYRFDPTSPAYNLTFSGRFRPLGDIEALRWAFV